MASKALRILVLLWAVWWLGVFMPGHQRGQVKVAGANDGSACHSCPTPDEQSPAETPVESSACCAVCYLVAGFDAPPVFDLDVPTLGLLDELTPDSLVAQITSVQLQRALHGRAPPLSATL